VNFRRSGRALSSYSLSVVIGLTLLLACASSVSAQVPIQLPPPAASTGPAAQSPRPAVTPGTPERLTQTAWRWIRSEYSDDSVTRVANPNNYTVTFHPDGTLAIRADCNQVAGTYVATASSQLTLRLGPTTLVACPPGSQADTFTRDLMNVVTYVFSGENLVMNMRLDAGNMIFEPQPALSLTDTSWDVQSYNNGRGGVTTIITGTQLNATFGADGHVSGSAGCNTFNGSYTVEGSNLSIGPLATTRRACPEPIMQQETAFLNALGATTVFELTAERLTLRDADGATQVIFVPAAG